ncbi:MAG TPA: phosphotransferase [Intrasporangium sp.]|uniref:phosphotransferase n=1 Tax=Intrasporangium sp. TaxID=1925024 RepID=UPI002D77B594|nr:phosphotransferase [Intrasporangium sp.]HET7397126.1 phosphotransferase [Intrasporangium sp.]
MSVTPLAPAAPRPLALPLPTPGWGAAAAVMALDLARPFLPLPLPADVHVLGNLTTVVLRAGAHVVKVYPPGTDPSHLDRLATAFAGSSTAHVPVHGAVATPHGVVTVAPRLRRVAGVSWRRLGALLRDFHEHHAAADLPAWTPLSRLAPQVVGLPDDAAAVLLRARDALLAALREVESELGVGTIHGDVSPSNVLRTVRRPCLIDLDWAAAAPREYDLASASRRYRAGEISPRAYAGFCRAYGYDVLGWPGLPVLDRVADLGGVAFRLWDCRHHGRDLDWLPEELKVWSTPL